MLGDELPAVVVRRVDCRVGRLEHGDARGKPVEVAIVPPALAREEGALVQNLRSAGGRHDRDQCQGEHDTLESGHGVNLPLGWAVRNILLGVSLAALLIRTSAAQGPDSIAAEPAMPVFSIGQPPIWRPYAAGLGVTERGLAGVSGLVGVQRPLLNPVTGLLAVSGEALGE